MDGMETLSEGLGGDDFNPEHAFLEVSGFDEYSELSNQDVSNLINTLIPDGHLANCGSIICNPNDPTWFEIPGTTGYHVEYVDGRPCEICLAGKEVLEGTGSSELEVLCHEIGHNAYNSLNLLDQLRWADIHDDSMAIYNETGFGFVSNYAHTNIFEDFAETYAVYMTNPDLLKFVSPEKYEFMQERVFVGIEYGQIQAGNDEWVLVTKEVADSYAQVENQLSNFKGDITSSEQNVQTDALYRCFNKIA